MVWLQRLGVGLCKVGVAKHNKGVATNDEAWLCRMWAGLRRVTKVCEEKRRDGL